MDNRIIIKVVILPRVDLSLTVADEIINLKSDFNLHSLNSHQDTFCTQVYTPTRRQTIAMEKRIKRGLKLCKQNYHFYLFLK